MLESIYFVISFILLLISILLVKKVDKKISITNSIIISYIIQLSLLIVLGIVLTICSVPVNGLSISIIYNIISIILIIYCIKKKQTQSYYIDFCDTLAFLIIMAILICIFVLVFTPNIQLKYFNTDTANIFSYVMKLFRTKRINSMYGSLLNCSLFLEIMEPVFSGMYIYKSFILCSTFMTFLNGMMFYVLISKVFTLKKQKILAVIVTVLYTIGWPLYSYVPGGWLYWGDGVTLCMFGIYLLYLYKENILYRKIIIILLLVNVYCIAVTYMLFTPYVIGMYVIAIAYFFFLEVKDRTAIKKFLKKIFFTIAVLGVMLLILVYSYFNGNLESFFSYLNKDGGIHRELYRDFIYFTPAICYAFNKCIRKKKIELNLLLYASFFIMVVGSFCLCLANIMSPYYYFRLYFILWMLTWLIVFEVLKDALSDSRVYVYIYSLVMCTLCILTFTPLEEIIINNGLRESKTVEFPLYSAVGSYVKSPAETIYDDTEFWELLEYIQNYSVQAPLIINGEGIDYYYWYCPLVGVDSYTDDEFNFIKEGDIPPIFVFENKCEISNERRRYIDMNFEILFENEYARIYEKKSE